jgi:hypothetical protein
MNQMMMLQVCKMVQEALPMILAILTMLDT